MRLAKVNTQLLCLEKVRWIPHIANICMRLSRVNTQLLCLEKGRWTLWCWSVYEVNHNKLKRKKQKQKQNPETKKKNKKTEQIKINKPTKTKSKNQMWEHWSNHVIVVAILWLIFFNLSLLKTVSGIQHTPVCTYTLNNVTEHHNPKLIK